MERKNLVFNIKNWKLKVKSKFKKDKIRKMKIEFELPKEETEAWIAFKTATIPPNMSDEDYIKTVFYRGIEAITLLFEKHYQKLREEKPELFKDEEKVK